MLKTQKYANIRVLGKFYCLDFISHSSPYLSSLSPLCRLLLHNLKFTQNNQIIVICNLRRLSILQNDTLFYHNLFTYSICNNLDHSKGAINHEPRLSRKGKEREVAIDRLETLVGAFNLEYSLSIESVYT